MTEGSVRPAKRSIATTRETLAAVVAFALFLTAVGGLGDRVAGSNDLAAKARAAQERAGSYRFEMTERFTGSTRLRAPVISMHGSFDVRAGIGRFVTGFRALGFNASCTYMFTRRGALYVSVHPSRRASVGAPWMRTDAASDAAALGFRPDEVYSRGKQFLAKVERAGTAVVRGVRTTRYEGVRDLSAFLTNASSRPAQAELARIRTVPFEVYIDTADLIRRVVVHLENRGLGLTITMDFFDYGDPVYLHEPKGAETTAGSVAQTALACYPSTFGRRVRAPGR